jgi:hypothetical protein
MAPHWLWALQSPSNWNLPFPTHYQLPDSESDLSSTIPTRFELSSEGQSLWAFIPSDSEVIIVRLSPPIRTDGKQIYLEKEKEAHRCVRSLHGHFQNVISCVYRKTCQQVSRKKWTAITVLFTNLACNFFHRSTNSDLVSTDG